VIVAKLDDEQMLKYMANENQTDFATSFVAEVETIHAVVQAFKDGKITLERPGKKTAVPVRIAPSFIPKRSQEHVLSLAFTGVTVAKFLGWTYIVPSGPQGGMIQAQERVKLAILALELIEQGHLKLAFLEEFALRICGSKSPRIRTFRDT
jgi:hypothetical protein